MPVLFKSVLAIAILFHMTSLNSMAQATLSPAVLNILIVASEKDGGVHLNMVADIAIAAYPDMEADIRRFVDNIPKENRPQIAAEIKDKQPDPIIVVAADHVMEEANPEDFGFFSFQGWDGEVELNYLRAGGNTRQESLGLGGKLKRNTDQFHHIITSFFDLNRNTGIKDKQRWGLSYKLDYDFSEKLYVTSLLGYENDQFGTFRERITTSLGLGYPVIATDNYSWKIEGGPSILFTKNLPGDGYQSSFNAFASSLFDWTINDRSNFTNSTIVYFGNRNVIESKSALKVKINGSLSSKFSYDIIYDRNAPLERKKNDSIARAGLLYDF